MRRARALAALAALATSLACAGARGGPRPARAVPREVDGAADAEIAIEGSGFDAAVTTDFGDGSGAVDAGFTAWLTPSSGGDAVPLAAVAFSSREALRATVPAGLAHGLYDLAVADAAGRTGFVAGALRVVTPSGALASFRVAAIAAQGAGGAFTVAVTALDAAGAVVDGYDGAVTLSDRTGALAPAEARGFVAGELRAPVSIDAILDGAVEDVVTVSDGAGHDGASEPFALRPGLPAGVRLTPAALPGAAGGCLGPFAIEILDRLGNRTAAGSDLRVSFATAPPLAAGLFTDAACTAPASAGSVRIAAEETGATLWIEAAAAGIVTLRARPERLPSASLEATITAGATP